MPSLEPHSPIIEPDSGNREFLSDASLLFIAIIWGSTFIIVKQAIADIPAFAFLTLRFALAFSVLILICFRRLKHLNLRMLLDGGLLGGALFLAFSTQTLGLQYAPASVVAFVTGLYVVFVPIFSSLFIKKFPTPYSIAGVLLSGVGLGLITLNGTVGLSRGEMFALLSALFCSIHIILTDIFSRKHDTYLLTTIQIGTTFLLSGMVSAMHDPFTLPRTWHPQLVTAIALTGILATVVGFFVQTGMQRFTTPTKAAIIFCMEPVSSIFFGYFIGGELLAARQYLGAALIVGAMLTAEIGSYYRIKSQTLCYGNPGG